MCYSISFLERKASKLLQRYSGILPPSWKENLKTEGIPENLSHYYFVSGFIHPVLPVIKHSGPDMLFWGLIPHWAKDGVAADKIRKGTLNAVGETVSQKPSFRKSFRSNRCVLPVSGFFEWRAIHNAKYPYYIYPAEEAHFSLGCIYDTWTDQSTGEIIKTFSIITTPANPLMAEIHNRKKRMPFILKTEQIASWIDPASPNDQILSMIAPLDEKEMCAHPVSRDLNYANKERNTPAAIKEHHYPELPSLSTGNP